jgi:hypothetical protein
MFLELVTSDAMQLCRLQLRAATTEGQGKLTYFMYFHGFWERPHYQFLRSESSLKTIFLY